MPRPVNATAPAISGVAQQSHTLTASTGGWSGNPTSYGYQWQDCTAIGCTDIPGATDSSYTLQASDVGSTIAVVVTAANAGGSTAATSAQTATVKPLPPTNTSPPAISGTPQDGQTLTATTGSWSHGPTSYGYQWQDCSGSGCSDISGATNSTYKLASSDVGDKLDVIVTATNAGGSTPATSDQTPTVKPLPPPSNTTVPAISGTAQQGQTLTTTPGSWTNSPTTYSYQWQDCTLTGCSPIGGATGTNYTLQPSDLGYTVDVVVTAANDGGSASATAAPSATVTTTSNGMSGTGLHVSAPTRTCPDSTASTCTVLLDGNGNVVHMHGVNVAGTDYSCIQNHGIWDNNSGSDTSPPPIQPLLDWHVNFVRVLLNEDCWLGINQGSVNPAYYGANYRNAIVSWVNDLHSHGIYTEIVDMWNAPGAAQATYQDNAPDADHSHAMWVSMAQTFANDPETILSPGGEEAVSFSCQFNGCNNEATYAADYDALNSPCQTHYTFTASATQGSATLSGVSSFAGLATGQGISDGGGEIPAGSTIIATNSAAGTVTMSQPALASGPLSVNAGTCWFMKAAGLNLGVSVLRATGFKGPIALECANWGNTCSYGGSNSWLGQVAPDPQSPSQLMAEVHEYGGNANTSPAAENSQFLPIIQAGYPLFYGEVGEQATAPSCANSNVPQFISWIDAHGGTGFEAWAFSHNAGCAGLVSDQATGAVQPAATFTATTSASSATLTSVSSFSNVAVGQIVLGAGIPVGTTITAFDSNAATVTMSQPATASDSAASLSAAGWQGWLQAHMQSAYTNPAPMNIISQGQPAYGEGTVLYAPSNAVSADYGSEYRCTAPCALDLDLAGVPAAQRQQVAVAWYADQSEFYAESGIWSNNYYNEPRDYTIDVNTAAGGGSPPTSGWTTLATVNGNVYDSRMHVLNLAGANWIRMRVTATNGSPGNTDAMFHLDVLNASAGTSDSWLIVGDSTTGGAMTHTEPSNFMQQVNGTESQYYPVEIGAGQGGWEAKTWTTTDAATGNPYVMDALGAYPGHYVAVDLGANEANNNDTGPYIANMTTILDDVIAAGKVPELRYGIDWMCTTTGSANGPTINADLQTLIATYPQAVVGPDEWQFLGSNTSLIASDCLHPSTPAGMQAYRQQYVNTLLTDVYGH